VGEAAFLAFHNDAASAEQIAWLISKDILVEPSDREWPGSFRRQAVPDPCEQLAPIDRATVLDILSAAAARISVHTLLKLRGFGWAYRSVIATKEKHGSANEGDARRAAAGIRAAFQATDLLMGKTNRCLPRSLAFLRLCNAQGHFPSLVVGVRTNPFTAHAWVQAGDTVLNDGVDQVRVFTPIMVL
jgi:hypothetical protein